MLRSEEQPAADRRIGYDPLLPAAVRDVELDAMRQVARGLLRSSRETAMESRPAIVLLGLAALFLGGLTGGVLGSMLLGKARAERAPQTASPDPANEATERELARAIEELALRIRALGEPSTDDNPLSDRQPVSDPTTDDASAEERLAAALDRLSTALELAQGRAAPGGIGITPLVLPPMGSKLAALEALAGRDWEEVSREYRFWTFQQVLDRFGRPDRIEQDRWIYELDLGDGVKAFSFQFSQGYLTNIYD
jgi:hypothetical protein